MESVALLCGDITDEEHNWEDPSCKQEDWKRAFTDCHARQRFTVFIENGEVQHEQTDRGGDLFAIVVV